MSVDGFVEASEARLSVLKREIAEIIRKDGGRKVHAHMRHQLAEVDALNTAIHKAQRRGLGRGGFRCPQCLSASFAGFWSVAATMHFVVSSNFWRAADFTMPRALSKI